MLSKPHITVTPITYHNLIYQENDIPSKHTVKTRTLYRNIKYIYFELFSSNIKTIFTI